MPKLPETGIDYYTYQFSGANPETLNDPKKITALFETFNGPDQKVTTYSFEQQGITSIAISPEGAVQTIHTWPHESEDKFGIITEYQGPHFHKPTARKIADTFTPGSLHLEHTPRINHSVALFELPIREELLEPTNLAKHLHQFVEDSKLNGIPTHQVAHKLPLLTDQELHDYNALFQPETTILGEVLTNSSLIISTERDIHSSTRMRIMLDCMTCEEKRGLEWLPAQIIKTYHPQRLLIASQEFGPRTRLQGEVITASNNANSQVFMRKFKI